MNRQWSGHGDLEQAPCCQDEAPCRFHARYPGAVRSPHRSPQDVVVRCPECEEEVAGPVPRGTIETGTS